MSTTQTVPRVKDTAKAGELYISFELSDKKWKLTASDGRRGPSRYNVDAGDNDSGRRLHWQGCGALQAGITGPS